MRRWLFSILILAAVAAAVFGVLPAPARAQNQPVLGILKISLWPEYDRPGVLVIYRASLANATTLPVNITFRIPLNAETFVVAVGATPDTVDEVSFRPEITGEWKTITFPATFPSIQFEYYDSGLRIDAEKRHYEYRWPGDYAVETMSIEVQKPLGAISFTISPKMGQSTRNEDGIEYSTSEFGSLVAGASFVVSLDYEKNTTTLTAEELRLRPSQPITVDTPGRSRLRTVAIWALAGLGLVLIVGGGWWYWRTGRKGPRSERKKRSRSVSAPAAEAASGAGAYCHQCGNRASLGDKYCRSCGTKLRAE